MANYKIRCEVVDISENRTVCPGSAKTRREEVFIIGPRTPQTPGMCGRAFHSIHPMALAMRFSEKMFWENDQGTVEVTCPDGFVRYRLTRIAE